MTVESTHRLKIDYSRQGPAQPSPQSCLQYVLLSYWEDLDPE